MEIRATGLAGQIRFGTAGSLDEVVTSELTALPPNAEKQLANSICEYRNTDALGIAALGTLVGSKYSDSMRACSAHALREIHTKEALPHLARLLGSDSSQVRYDAVIGIAQYAMSFPIVRMEDKPATMAKFTPPANVTNEMRKHYPSQGLFAKDENTYISFWETWLVNHRAN